jgi:hypothetical protein
MGGAPTIQGGMTAAEQEALLEKQNQWAAEADERRNRMMREYEAERIANEKNLIEAAKQAEMMKTSEQQSAEEQLAEEVRAYEEAQAMGQMSSGYSNLLESLNRGISGSGSDTPRPR